MWRVRVHQLRRVAHAARCASCDHSGTRGAAAPVSNPVRGGGGGARASPFAQASCGSSWPSRGLLKFGRPDLSYLNWDLPVASTRLPRRARGLPCLAEL